MVSSLTIHDSTDACLGRDHHGAACVYRVGVHEYFFLLIQENNLVDMVGNVPLKKPWCTSSTTTPNDVVRPLTFLIC